MVQYNNPLHASWLNGSLILAPGGFYGKQYFVAENGGNDSNNGESWDTAFDTLAVALAASHANIALTNNWGKRNVIYYAQDGQEEDLTKLAQKTDVVGCGTMSQHPRPRLDGNHVCEAQGTADYMGCRFFNIEFYGQSAGIIIDIPANQNGIEFWNCVFSATNSATIGIRAVQAHDMVIKLCWFDPNTSGTAFSTAAVQINAGSLTNFLMEDCRVISGGIGLDFNCTAGQALNCWCNDNYIRSAGMPIDDEGDNLYVVNNRMSTALNENEDTGWSFNTLLASGNIVSAANGCHNVPDIHDAD